MLQQRGFYGVMSIAPTPFDEAGALNVDSIKSLVDFYLSKGVNGLTILGVMGEADKLLTDERARVIETYIGAANGRIPIVVGTTHAGTQPAVALARQAQKLGAAGLMIAPPPVAGMDAAELIKAHYQAISDAVSIPIVVQDYPISSGVILSPELLAKMARSIKQVQYLKLEDPPTPVKLQRVRQQAGDRLGVMGGLGGMFYFEELEQGALGTMTGYAFPEIWWRFTSRIRPERLRAPRRFSISACRSSGLSSSRASAWPFARKSSGGAAPSRARRPMRRRWRWTKLPAAS